MNRQYFKYRAKWIKDCRKLSQPYLVIGHGRLRFSNDWQTYDMCVRDFTRSLVQFRHSTIHRRLAMIHDKERRNHRHDEWVVESLFGDSPLALMVRKFRFRSSAA